MIMPDNVPLAPSDPAGLQSFAYCYGYIRALIQAVDNWDSRQARGRRARSESALGDINT
jgi:hypothetical protein